VHDASGLSASPWRAGPGIRKTTRNQPQSAGYVAGPCAVYYDDRPAPPMPPLYPPPYNGPPPLVFGFGPLRFFVW
jgi:hypothetical protein